MRTIFSAMIILSIIPIQSYCQSWQGVLLLDTRSGYTGNAYLNPYFAEWDRSGESGYFMGASLGQISYAADKFSTEATAGYVYQPFFDERDTWTGLFTSLSGRYRISDHVSAGMETGASYFSTILRRDLFWLQPVITVTPSLFTQLRFKAGSSFRTLHNFDPDGSNVSDRYDSYTIEIETWPGFRWQVRSALYGNIADPSANIGLRSIVEHRIDRSFRVNINAGFERFGYTITSETGGGGGFPPIGNPGGELTTSEADFLLRGGLGAAWQLNRNLSFLFQGDLLNYSSSASGESFTDIHVTAGVRVSLFPSIGDKDRADVEWTSNGTQQVFVQLNYKGDGRLFITGDFNDWDKPGVPLSNQNGNRYAARLELEPGVYEYKILLVEGSDENWVELSDETYTVTDSFGGTNGMIFID
ncbi:glycogen-binding domain-containing protein [Rhodohalobacter mucosus]|uniref:AMP-activated protein kinase glycogen-binding domain-containing protein n=1 Tax=Rhodohalobacter mucosus TaxID=2079485 RepID=A0A316TL36_9BACT|nr:glycogen-binding domain-containing protein [Rhodohalobacter mucosus]PWN05283.1 hypothetical protein DDZ15_14490 [Rhodohalobacter mucosus]